VSFVERLRSEVRFDRPADLVAAMEDDVDRARCVLEGEAGTGNRLLR